MLQDITPFAWAAYDSRKFEEKIEKALKKDIDNMRAKLEEVVSQDKASDISPEAAARIAALPTYRLPTDLEIDWLAKLIDLGVYHHLTVSDRSTVAGLIEQGYAVEIVHQRNGGCYAATMKGWGFFTGLYDVETIPEALAAYQQERLKKK